jgi:hypothetical protein
MDELQAWLKHGDKFTLFLRQTRTPLDHDLCERALKTDRLATVP